jgi:xanthine dehydrogenase YagS FAD-binding subunit
MRPFAFVNAADESQAFAAKKNSDTEYIAGGTSLLDLMRLDVMRPSTLVDVNALAFGKVEETSGVIRVGALVKNSDLAYHPIIAQRFPVLSQALLSGASPQLRNMASVGGNVMQRTRCPYFREPSSACNKRTPGSGCAALDGGFTRSHAVLGGTLTCIATHPSDMCVALLALDASLRLRSAGGAERVVALADFHTLPADHPEIENVLKPGELIAFAEIPAASPFAARSRYVKARDRASYAFALASAAVAVDLDGQNIRDARVALGGVATKPWRSREAEAALIGKPATAETFQHAAEAALAGAKTQKDNAFKVDLARRVIVRALRDATGAT